MTVLVYDLPPKDAISVDALIFLDINKIRHYRNRILRGPVVFGMLHCKKYSKVSV